VYKADAEIPNEPFTYVGHAGGRGPTKIAEKSVWVLCWLSERSLAIVDTADNGSQTLVVQDMHTGRRRTLLRNVSPMGCTADGRRIFLGSRRGVDLYDVASGSHRTLFLLPPLPATDRYEEVHISPDRRYVSYMVERARTADDRNALRFSSYDIFLMDRSTRQAKLIHRAKVRGGIGAGYALWRPTSDGLLLSITRPRPNCTAKQVGQGTCQQLWDLALVDAETASLTTVVSGLEDVPDSFWSPDGTTLAYSAGEGVFVVGTDGSARKLPGTTGYRLFGRSPDGRYLGLTRQSPFWINGKETKREIAVLELATGKVRTVFKTRAEWLAPTWWR
jgi:hypothetical protein